ncbi:transporter substrate-binding domain-containing protein [Pseudalkalibacillus sp. SCS-8]|uniref:transporter substrate-binding domain-containing protein n=1 Tax=Pseudalkalibacillus nanhaiensis TaxID=3115291 RepID=UPI0032DA9567
MNVKGVFILMFLLLLLGCTPDNSDKSEGEPAEKTSVSEITVEEPQYHKDTVYIAEHDYDNKTLSRFSQAVITNILKDAGIKHIEFIQFPTVHDEKAALSLGELDIIPELSFLFKEENIETSMTYFHDTEYDDYLTFGVRKEDEALLTIINKGILKLRENDELAKLHDEFFGDQVAVKDETKAETEEEPAREEEKVAEPVQPEKKPSQKKEQPAESKEPEKRVDPPEGSQPEEPLTDEAVAYIDLFNMGGYIIFNFLNAYENDDGDTMGTMMWEMSNLLTEMYNATPPDYLANTHQERLEKADEAMGLMEGYIDFNWQHGNVVEQSKVDRLRDIGNEFMYMK